MLISERSGQNAIVANATNGLVGVLDFGLFYKGWYFFRWYFVKDSISQMAKMVLTKISVRWGIPHTLSHTRKHMVRLPEQMGK